MRIFSNTAGFTLIEILIAAMIISIASLGVASLTVGIIRGNSFSKQVTMATTLAQDQLENVKRLGYTNSSSAVGTEDYGSIQDYTAFKRVTSVTNNTPSTNISTVNVTVYWNADLNSIMSSTILAE
jgi:prepilin-type N-terminal cleavage/methylation domain-containing protein